MRNLLISVIVFSILLSCNKTPEEVPVQSVSLNQNKAEMLIGEKVQLKATVLPGDATYKSVTWASSKQSVANVSDAGLVTAIAEGSSTITASAGGKSAVCTITVNRVPIEVSSIVLSQTTIALDEGDETILMATVKPDDADDKTVLWSTSDATIATVQEGKVFALMKGEASITAKAGGKSASCKIIVKKKVIPVESIELDSVSLTMMEGESETLSATVKPDNATDKTISWSTSDISVATVEDGKVTAVKEGETTITAKAGDKTATCKIVVAKKVIPVESIELDRVSLTMVEGESETLTATVKPEDATDKMVIWLTSDSTIATVENGLVVAVKEGETTISVKAGEKQASCRVIVVQKPEVTSIRFTSNSFNGNIGSDYSVSVILEPDNAQYDIEWAVSDSRVASIQGAGMSASIHTLDFGQSDIIAKDKISGLFATITVSTVVNEFAWTESTGETYSGYPLISINVNAEHQLQYNCIPSTATKLFSDLGQFVFYEPYVVGTPTCISLSEDGIVKGITEGMVGIKPTGRIIKKSGEKDRIYIMVKPAFIPVQGISLDISSLILTEGESKTLTATVTPSNATDKNVTWSSSDATVVTVENGCVTAVKEGEAIISAVAGEQTATCAIVVRHDALSDAIVFVDSKIKEKLVAAFDTNSDGELSYHEAAAVSSGNELKNAFGAIKTYKSFDEFEYFTGINSIPDSMFEDWQFTSTIMPQGISTLPNKCFKGCTKLTSVILPDTISQIGSYAFNGCSNLAAITIPVSVSNIGSYAFCNCSALLTIVIPDGVTSICDLAFAGCFNLSSIVIPSSVSIIGTRSFEGCVSLLTITIPDGVNSIGNYCFKGCSRLASVIIPDSVTSIGPYAFEDCSGLSSVSISSNVSSIDRVFRNCTSLSSVIIPDSVTMIWGAFSGCTSLTNVSIPESVTNMGGAFKNCTSLTTVNIPGSVNDLSGSFEGCTSLTTVNIPQSVTNIGGAFKDCSSLKTIIIPDSVSCIGAFAFDSCTSLSSVVIPDSVTKIETWAFRYCHGLSSISLPGSVTSIGYASFGGCTGLLDIIIPDSVTSIESYAFVSCSSLASVYVKAKTPPAGSLYMFDDTPCTIYVPEESLDAYKAAKGWIDYADRIHAISEQ